MISVMVVDTRDLSLGGSLMKATISQLRFISIVLLVVLLAGCAGVPLAPDAEDAAAKTFQPPPGKANIYVYRPSAIVASLRTVQIIHQGHTVTSLANGTFAVIKRGEGKHQFAVYLGSGALVGQDLDTVVVEVVAGQNYFIEVDASSSYFSPDVAIRRVDEMAGRKAIECCKLVK